MAQQTVPVLQIDANNEHGELCHVPLADLDDFLEDISDDYDLAPVELGSLFKKIGKAVKKVGKKVGRVTAAVSTGGASELAIRGAKKLRKKAKAGVKLSANVKVSARGLGKLKQAVAKHKKQATQAQVVLSAAAKTPAIKLQLPRLQLNRQALVHKKAAKHAAQVVTSLAPAQLKPAAAAAIGAAVVGTPHRPEAMAKPAAKHVAKQRARGKRPAIVAKAKSHAPQPGELRKRYHAKRQSLRAKPMHARRFKLTVHALITALDKRNTSPAIGGSLRRLRLVTGVGNAQ